MRRHRARTAAAALAAATALATGCTDGAGTPAAPSPSGDRASEAAAEETGETGAAATADPVPEVVETVAEGLPSPWGLVALPDGGLLVGSRDEAAVFRVAPGSGEVTEVARVPGVDPDGEGGLLGLALSPEGDRLYAYHTAAADNRVVSMPYADGELGAPEVVLDGIPRDAVIHHGGGLAFGPDGMLYAATGDAADPELAQDPGSLAGKILRMTPGGGVPEDNPTDGSLVYSLGHRNVQGLAWDGQDRLWASEFGARSLDELNLITAGGNYGWPEYEGSGGQADGFRDPAAEWPVAEASPSGLAYARGALWMAALRGERLWMIPLGTDGTTGTPRSFFEGEFGRLRSVLATGDGGLLLVTNETDTRGTPEERDDRVLRLRLG